MNREQLQEQLAREVQCLTPAQLKAGGAFVRYLSWARKHGIDFMTHYDRIMQLAEESAKSQDFDKLIKYIESLYLMEVRC